ncbi:MAG: cytochrome b/b6 domain-containing protein [Salinarimonas sp.]
MTDSKHSGTALRFDGVTKAFHWTTAILIVAAFALGLVANAWPYDDTEQLAMKAWLFSAHKTLGVAIFFVSLGRIGWALTHRHPPPLHPQRRLETLAAATVHWALYISLVAVPLTGWIHHAATTGFAPIWWPFGQTLPFVAQDARVEHTAASLHLAFTKLLAAAILLHVAGALKHHLIDRDDTLRRMWPGKLLLLGKTPSGPGRQVPAAPALAVFTFLAAAGLAIAFDRDETTAPRVERIAEQVAAVQAGEWQVVEGALSFTVTQMGSPVTGSFADWSAEITFDENAAEPRHGDVIVVIDIDSLSLGSVTRQAKGANFMNAADHPHARFTADILAAENGVNGENGYLAKGTLALAGAEVPVFLPFSLEITGDEAHAQGSVTVDRRDFGIGDSHPDDGQVGFSVEIRFDLTATRSAPED